MTQKDSEDDTRRGETPPRSEIKTVENLSCDRPLPADTPEPPSLAVSEPETGAIPQREAPSSPPLRAPATEAPALTATDNPDEFAGHLPPQAAIAAPPEVSAPDAEPEGGAIIASSYDALRAPSATLVDPESALTDHVPVDGSDEDVGPLPTAPDEPLSTDATEQVSAPLPDDPPADALQPVRPAWETPPPIIDAPSWQWRDVGPEITSPPEQSPQDPEAQPLHGAGGNLQSAIIADIVEPQPPVSPREPLTSPEPSTRQALPPQDTASREPARQAASLRAAFQDAPVRFDTQPADEPSRWDRAKDFARTGARYAAYAVGGYFAIVFVLILLYRFVNPTASSLMIVQSLTGTSVNQEWVPLDDISPALVRAVIVSEDWSFCEHYGIDINAIEQAIERSGNGIPRGASTISMQTTKNLFLWNAKSYIRKAVELPLTLAIETVWPKRRILEIYLNVAEWGPGIFGAEAAAQYHFNKPASRLGEREAAQLAASLPNPIIREAGDPGPRTARKATVIQSRMRNAGGAAQCVLGGDR